MTPTKKGALAVVAERASYTSLTAGESGSTTRYSLALITATDKNGRAAKARVGYSNARSVLGAACFLLPAMSLTFDALQATIGESVQAAETLAEVREILRPFASR